MSKSDQSQREYSKILSATKKLSLTAMLMGSSSVEKAQEKATEADQEYKQTLADAEEFREAYYTKELPYTLDLYQQEAEKQYSEIDKMFRQYLQIYTDLGPSCQKATQCLHEALDALDLENDMQYLFQEANARPADVPECSVEYIPFPGMYWADPCEDDIGVRAISWEEQTEKMAKSTGWNGHDNFVTVDEVKAMEREASRHACQICDEADSLAQKGEHEKAGRKYLIALEKFKFAGDEDGITRAQIGSGATSEQKEIWSQATQLRGEAAALMQQSDYAAAAKKYREAEEAYNSCGNDVGATRSHEGVQECETRQLSCSVGHSLCNEADTEMEKAGHQSALLKFNKAEEKFREAHDTVGLARSTEGKAKAKQIISTLKQASALHEKGDEMMRKQKYDQAVATFEQAKTRYEGIDDSVGVKSSKNKIAEALAAQSNIAPPSVASVPVKSQKELT